MAITTRYAVNMAMQYNEVELDGFLINPSVGSRRFLTEAEQTRLLRATEVSALYFITDTSGQFYSARYRWYDSGGTMLNEYLLDLTGAGVHNSIPVDWSSFFVPSGAVRLTVAIIGAVNGFANGQFTLGTGNTFTSWTLTQPSRTNYILNSQSLTASFSGVVGTNDTIAPDGTMTADSFNVTDNTNGGTFKAITLVNGNTYTYSVWLKGSVNGQKVLVQTDLNGDLTTFTLSTEWVRYSVTFVANSSSAQNVYLLNGSYITPASNEIYYTWEQQLEDGSFVTPNITTAGATVTTSLGEFLQDATGGPDGSRCLKMWVDTSGVSTQLTQNVDVVNAQVYTISFWARVDVLYGNDYLTGPTDASLIDSTEWKRYTQSYTAGGTGSTAISFDFTNDANYGFVYIDDISISLTSPSLLSEERTYLLDDSCVAYEYQLNWLNKLGGRDTWVMTGFPTETVEVRRNNEVEYSARTNYTSANRIYGYRENKSRKSITLSHQCKDRATAEWLKSELIDSIDVMLLIDGVYYPCDVVPSSIVIRNTFSQDYTVRVTLRYAYDINVQTR